MYSYGYSYGYGLIGGNTYNPLINYDWSTTTASGLRYLKDVGSTPTYNASMYFGRGAYFNGVDQEILKDIEVVNSTSLCFRMNTSIPTTSVFGRSDTANFISIRPTNIEVRIAYGTIISFLYSAVVGETHDYVIQFGVNSCSLYVDGILISTESVVWNYSSSYKLTKIGRGTLGYFKGTLKDLYVFNRGLTQAEITQSYEQPELFYAMAQADSTCVLNMPMCETSSTARNYKTGIDYTITNYTTSVRDNAKNLQYGLQTCKFVRDSLGVIQSASNYLEGDGVGYANTGWIPPSTSNFTIECIMKIYTKDDIGSYDFQGIGIHNQFHIKIFNYAYGSLAVGIGRDSSNTYGIFKNTQGMYSYITVAVFESEFKVHVNGALASTTSRVVKDMPTTSFYLSAPRLYETTQAMKTDQRLFKVHDKALTQAEITANYNSYVAKGLLV